MSVTVVKARDTVRRAARGRRFLSRDVLLPPAKAAAYLGVEVATLRRWLRAGLLPYEVPRGVARPVRRVRMSDLEAFLERKEGRA